MSLTQGVRFRILADELTSQEMHSFLLQLVTDSSDLIVSAMFHYFNLKSTDPSSTEYVMQKMTELINLRQHENDNKQSSALASKQITWNEIPMVLISKTASYLGQKSYTNLCKVNRHAHLGCHLPNSLQEIYFDFDCQDNYHPFDCSFYTSVTKLYLDIGQARWRTIEIRKITFMDQLQSITLDASSTNATEGMVLLLLIHFPICHNVTELCLKWWKAPSILQMEDENFYDILTKFPNVQYLQLLCVPDAFLTLVPDMFSDLEGLHVQADRGEDLRKYDRLLNAVADHLKHLSISGTYSDVNYDVGGIDFNKLEELRLYRVGSNTVNDILQTANNLQQISLQLCYGNFTEILANCLSLKYIELYQIKTANMVTILKQIEEGLTRTKDIKREEIKICVKMAKEFGVDRYDPYKLIKPINAIVHRLESSNIDQYILIYQMQNVGGKTAKEIANRFAMKTIVSCGNEFEHSSRGMNVVIQNDECVMNGYNQSWRMCRYQLYSSDPFNHDRYRWYGR